jgi:signal peptidase I
VPTPLIAETAAMTAPGEFAPLAPPRRRLRPRTVVALIVVVLLVGVPSLVRIFFLEAFKIPHAGMSPTLLAGDHVFVRKDAYGTRAHRTPARGDVVVFRHPEHPEQDFVQRVIGLPGDTITVQEAAIFINGWRIPTCVAGFGELEVGDEKRVGIAVVELLGDTAYLVFHDQQKLHASQHTHEGEGEGEAGSEDHHQAPPSEGPYTVPPGEVFVFGDNRENCLDSRHWFEGRGGGVRVDQVKGRASTVWMARKKSGGTDRSRIGLDLSAAPKCPEGFGPQTCAGLERCLSSRPPRETTTPPADRSTGAPVSTPP